MTASSSGCLVYWSTVLDELWLMRRQVRPASDRSTPHQLPAPWLQTERRLDTGVTFINRWLQGNGGGGHVGCMSTHVVSITAHGAAPEPCQLSLDFSTPNGRHARRLGDQRIAVLVPGE
jgi:hypothetical protein